MLAGWQVLDGVGGGVGGLLKVSQVGVGGYPGWRITGAIPTGQRRYFQQRITVF